MDIDRFTHILGQLTQRLPTPVFDGLNLGIGVSEEMRFHAASRPGEPRYTLGEYRVSHQMGRGIMLFYGSFMAVFPYLSEEEMTLEIDKVIKHELTHHLESQAGSRDLEIADARRLMRPPI